MLRNLNAKRVVVKVGTSSLIKSNGAINHESVRELSTVLCQLKMAGKEVVLVSSGAIGAGMGVLGMTERPTTIPKQQAVASIGQGELIGIYERQFADYGISVAQLLLTRDVLQYPQSKSNVKNAFDELLKMNVIPVVNENDTISVDELDHKTKFGDNDQLSATVAKLVDADLLIMLSDIDGFYTDNPLENPQAKLIHTISHWDQELLMAAGGKGSKFGTGGMVTKLKAAKHIMDNHQQMVLANGADPMIINNILAGEEIGTLFSEQVSLKSKEIR